MYTGWPCGRQVPVMTLFLKFYNLSQLLCHFCPLCSRPSKIEQAVEQQNSRQQKPGTTKVTLYVHYNRARPTLLTKERRHHSYDTYDYDSTVFHNEGFTNPCIMDFSLTMIPVLNGPRAENHDTNFRENAAPAPTGRYHGFQYCHDTSTKRP